MIIRRGIIREFDSSTYLADVQIVGSMATMLTQVPVAKQIGAGLLTSGSRCGVLFFDETNPSDACVAFVYDGAPGAWITSALIKDGEIVEADLAFDPAVVDSGETISADWLWSTDKKIQFRDAQIYIHSAADGYLDLVADTAIRLGGAGKLELYDGAAYSINLYSAAADKLKTDDQFIYEGFGARVYNDSPLTIPNAAWTALAMNSERFDNDSIHDTVTNNSRLTCKTAGIYVISASIAWDGNLVGRRVLGIRLNGITLITNSEQNPANDARGINATTIYELAVNDYVECVAYQTSGGNLDILAAGNQSPEFGMARIG